MQPQALRAEKKQGFCEPCFSLYIFPLPGTGGARQ